MNLKAWATSLVKQHDKNGNMMLEPDEQGFLGSSAASEDLNHDGVITIDEIVAHHSAGAPASTAPASTSITATSTSSSSSGHSSDRDRDRERYRGYSRREGDSNSDGKSKTDDAMAKRVFTGTAGGTGKDADKRHSYRFSTATDKLPTGVPSWFKSRDNNGDGQVSLSEYSRTMSESVVSEFRRYDLNNDGIITAKEAAKAK
jgi:Ca2+-binding EF-hand superfamily protein